MKKVLRVKKKMLIYFLFLLALYLTAHKNCFNISLPKSSQSTSSEILDFKSKLKTFIYNISCKRLFEMDTSEIDKAKLLLKNLRNKNPKKPIDLVPDLNYIFNKTHCQLYKDIKGFNNYIKHKLIDDFEYQFPLAYSILTYNNAEEFERMLLAIYRPQNVYCIHVDNKSDIVFKKAIESIVSCFDNVFITTKLLDIVYAGFNRLQADIGCMNDLLKATQKHPSFVGKKLNMNWKYILNMASTEFPLKTNYELTRILNMYNGSNEIEVFSYIRPRLVKFKYAVKYDPKRVPYMACTNTTKTKPPHNYTIVKGSAYNVFSRRFVQYVVGNQYAKDLLAWGVDTYSPDEW